MRTKGLYSMEEFLKFKSAKDITFKVKGDISNISKFEVEANEKYKKNFDITINKDCGIIKTKDCIVEDLKAIASSYGLTFAIDKIDESYQFKIKHNEIGNRNNFIIAIDDYIDLTFNKLVLYNSI